MCYAVGHGMSKAQWSLADVIEEAVDLVGYLGASFYHVKSSTIFVPDILAKEV